MKSNSRLSKSQRHAKAFDYGSLVSGDFGSLKLKLRDSGCFHFRSDHVAQLFATDPLDLCRRLHQMPEETKAKCAIHHSPGNRGYFVAEGKGQIDAQQLQTRSYAAFEFGVGDFTPTNETEKMIYARNDWITHTAYDELITEIGKRFCDIADEIAIILSKLLGESPAFIKTLASRPCSQMRFLSYQAVEGIPDGTALLGAHTDYELFTILIQSEFGLQAFSRRRKWISIEPMSDAVIVMLGDMTHVLSNGYFGSCVHRVVPSNVNRESLAFFYGPDARTEISPLRRFGPPEFAPIVFEHHLAARTIENYPHLTRAHLSGQLSTVPGVGGGNNFKRRRFAELKID